MTLDCIQQPHPHLQANLEHGILTLAINRADAKNALYGELYLCIANAFDQADASKEVRVVILRGAEQDFTAGNDMKDFMGFIQKPLEGKAGDAPPFVLLKAAARFSKPLIIGVKGVAIGIGVTILLHADMVYADNSALFQIPFVSLGLSPEGAASRLLVQQAGYHKAAELLFTAKKFNAATAAQAGLVNDVVEDVYATAQQTAEQLAALPLASLKQTKALMKKDLADIITCVDEEAEIFMQRVRSPEMMEAVQAFMQKRKPDFSQFN
ncbi:MAG: enoyl-CoA hydratase [Acinetobacter sp.]|nr:enoyl-CoA hydratase/isomerase family protein [Acinetobacter sp.]MBP6352948.1 enoyl-CoA hydratase/isomerase family protein [Acinetobacter sp.]MBP7218160.1 enoyl-CoA hydratase/isomerase family protein [Acinetobacter sp.]TXJ02848.1 MAG: enoyl-CoA hydratase [Acinetobacter sp.]